MSMLKTLAKIAIGVMVVKGVSGMRQRRRDDDDDRDDDRDDDDRSERERSNTERQRRPGSGTVFGGPNSPSRRADRTESGQSVEDMLGDILSGRGLGTSPDKTPRSGGLGGVLDSLSQKSNPLGKGGAAPLPKGETGSFGDALNQSFDRYNAPEDRVAESHETMARVLVRAMLAAAKSDGKIDTAERRRLLDHLSGATKEEMAFVEAELARANDLQALVGDTPRGAEEQVYTMSAIAIDLDSKAEAEYLHDLARALGIDQASCNAIHEKLGIPVLYR